MKWHNGIRPCAWLSTSVCTCENALIVCCDKHNKLLKKLENKFHLQLQHATEKYGANCLAWNFTFKLIPLQKFSQTSFPTCLSLALHGKIFSVLAPCCYKNGFILCEIMPGQNRIAQLNLTFTRYCELSNQYLQKKLY